jgi:DNA-binding NtrC family response regulator
MDANVRAALRNTEIVAENSLTVACDRLRSGNCDAAVLSLASLDENGEDALGALFRSSPHLPVIVHHRTGTIDDVIHLTRQGAFHVLLGEIEPEALAEAVSRAARQAQMFPQVTQTAPWRRFLIGQSRSMLQICEIIQLVAAKRCTI